MAIFQKIPIVIAAPTCPSNVLPPADWLTVTLAADPLLTVDCETSNGHASSSKYEFTVTGSDGSVIKPAKTLVPQKFTIGNAAQTTTDDPKTSDWDKIAMFVQPGDGTQPQMDKWAEV